MVCRVRDLLYIYINKCIAQTKMLPDLISFLFEMVGQDMDGVFLVPPERYKARKNGLYSSCLNFTTDLVSL